MLHLPTHEAPRHFISLHHVVSALDTIILLRYLVVLVRHTNDLTEIYMSRGLICQRPLNVIRPLRLKVSGGAADD